MCEAASFSMVSASSWSLMEGSEIFFTITECPLTAVATLLVLIRLSVNSLEIALDTVPESTIMESTTISGASGSRPRCATSMPLRPFLSSTALMLEDPTSRPTIVFDPNPNMCPPLLLPGSLGSCLRFLSALRFHLTGLVFHPLVELRFLEAPAIAQFESRNLLLAYVLVKRVRTDSQVLRSLANVHHFPRVGHRFESLFRTFQPVSTCNQPLSSEEFLAQTTFERIQVSRAYISPESTRGEGGVPRFTGFYACFLETGRELLWVVFYILYGKRLLTQ